VFNYAVKLGEKKVVVMSTGEYTQRQRLTVAVKGLLHYL
jgi:hypothetical protein